MINENKPRKINKWFVLCGFILFSILLVVIGRYFFYVSYVNSIHGNLFEQVYLKIQLGIKFIGIVVGILLLSSICGLYYNRERYEGYYKGFLYSFIYSLLLAIIYFFIVISFFYK